MFLFPHSFILRKSAESFTVSCFVFSFLLMDHVVVFSFLLMDHVVVFSFLLMDHVFFIVFQSFYLKKNGESFNEPCCCFSFLLMDHVFCFFISFISRKKLYGDYVYREYVMEIL